MYEHVEWQGTLLPVRTISYSTGGEAETLGNKRRNTTKGVIRDCEGKGGQRKRRNSELNNGAAATTRCKKHIQRQEEENKKDNTQREGISWPRWAWKHPGPQTTGLVRKMKGRTVT